MFFPIEHTKKRKRVQGPVLAGYGDCRTCSLIEIVCEEEACPRRRKVCCWDCQKLMICLEDNHEMVEDLYGDFEDFAEAVEALRRRMKELK